MKKLRMIVTSVVVLAIVGSAFAFNGKKKGFTFCVSNDGDNTCDTYLQNSRRVISTPINFSYYTDWDGDKLSCTTSGNTHCSVAVRLTIE